MMADHFVYWALFSPSPASLSYWTLVLQLFFLCGMGGLVGPRGCGLHFVFFCASVFVFEAVGCYLKSTGTMQWL